MTSVQHCCKFHRCAVCIPSCAPPTFDGWYSVAAGVLCALWHTAPSVTSCRRLRDYGAVALLKVLCAWEGKKGEDSDAAFIRNLLHNTTGGMRLAVANRGWHSLELLDLSNNGIEEVGGVVVAAIICLGPKLLQCNLDWNSVRGRGALALGQALNSVPQSLRALSLDRNPLGDIGAAAIADALVCVLARALRVLGRPHIAAGTTKSCTTCLCASAE